MTFDEFEVHARREIQNYLDGTNLYSNYCEYQCHQVLKLEWYENYDTSEQKLSIFKITIDTNFNIVHFSLEVDYTFGEDKDSTYTSGTTDLPKSEEEYFQMNTVQDLGFRWEFYEYLYDVFNGLKIKSDTPS